MAREIERKFLVIDEGYRGEAFASERIVQGYICSAPGRTVRVRIRGKKGYLTIKGAADATGIGRYEFEQEIALEDAWQLMELCEPGVIDKVRYLVRAGSHVFEVDVFHGENEGLVVAEVELQAADESFERPAWLGAEVSHDRRYFNSMLARCPFASWKNTEPLPRGI